jgi:TRAP transporter TAXI family solute receptor
MVWRMNMTAWRIVPTLVATVVAAMLLYGAYESLTSTQVVNIASGTPGGGLYELGQKLELVLSGDLHEQRLEAPVVFQHVDSHGPRQNLELLADRQAQLGLALEGLSVKPKVTGGADIRGLMKLSTSTLHLIVGQHVTLQGGKPLTQFTDLLVDLRPTLGRPLRVYVGSVHSGTRTVMDLILNYYKASKDTGLHWELVEHGSYADMAGKLIQGELDVVCMLVATGSPAAVTMSHQGVLLALPNAVIEAIHTLRPVLLSVTIPAGVYNKDFPRRAVPTLGAHDILIANGEVSNRLAYRIVRTVATHWQELQSGMQLPENFGKAQLNQNDYYPLHPGAVAYYKGDNVPLWPWFRGQSETRY